MHSAFCHHCTQVLTHDALKRGFGKEYHCIDEMTFSTSIASKLYCPTSIRTCYNVGVSCASLHGSALLLESS
eukprot:4742699-Amphidinium_carterae.1